MTTPVIQRHDLGPPGSLTELGRGGEGVVFDVTARPGTVFKEYLPRTGLVLRRDALERLVALPARMSASDQRVLASRTAWPTALVIDGARLAGYLMPRIPDIYWRTHGARHDPRHVVCDWNFLAYRQQWSGSEAIVSDVPRATGRQALELVMDLARTMRILHRYDLVMGDVSGRNLLWTDKPEPRVFVIDCDAFRPEGGDAVCPSKESPEWDDPEVSGSRTTRASDVYKLGLAAYRAIWAASAKRPTGDLQLPEGVPDALADLVRRSVRPSGRPSAREWVDQLATALRFEGRPVVRIDAARRPGPGSDGPPTGPIAVTPTPRKEQPPGGRPVIPTG